MKTLILTDHASRAHEVQKEIDPTKENFRVAHIGYPLYGLRFDVIIVPSEVNQLIYGDDERYTASERARARQWMDECVRCRLEVGGKLVNL